MESSFQLRKASLVSDLQQINDVVTALKQEKLLTGMMLEEFEEDLSYCSNILDGTCKLTYIIQGDSQTGKTTFLNTLLDEVMIPSSIENCIIIMQHDSERLIPELFRTELGKIFNSHKQMFMIKPEDLTTINIQRKHDIQTALKEASEKTSDMKSESGEELNYHQQPVYVIKYRLEWLERTITDRFILDRIQFVDLSMSLDLQSSSGDILALEKLTSNNANGNIFIAEGPSLFSTNLADKYKELSKQKNSLLIINKTDLLQTKDHLRRIQTNLQDLCSNLKLSKEEILSKVEESEETEEMRSEIFLQSFYESQKIKQGDLKDEDIIHFVSELYTINKILLEKYARCSNDEEKAILNALFIERNKESRVFQSKMKDAIRQKADLAQIYLNRGAKKYVDTNFNRNVERAICKKTEASFMSLITDLLSKSVDMKKKKIRDCDAYINKQLSAQEIEELQALNKQVYNLFGERLCNISDHTNKFTAQFLGHLQHFKAEMDKIDPDFYVIRASRKKDLSDHMQTLEKNFSDAQNSLHQGFLVIEEDFRKTITDLIQQNSGRKHLRIYLLNQVSPRHDQLYRESLSVLSVICSISSSLANNFGIFLDGKKLHGIQGVLSHIYSVLFEKKKEELLTLDSNVHDFELLLRQAIDDLINIDFANGSKRTHRIKLDFEDYLSSATGNAIDKAQDIISQKFQN